MNNFFFKDRRRYVAACKDCGWDDTTPPFEFFNDLCPKCHAEVIYHRVGLAPLATDRPLEATVAI